MVVKLSNHHIIKYLYKLRDSLRGIRCFDSLSEISKEIDSLKYKYPEKILIQKLGKLRYHLKDSEIPDDPYSEEYRYYQLDLYKKISNRKTLPEVENQLLNEFPQISEIYPYTTRDTDTIGDSTLARGYWLRHLELPENSRVVEMGSGQGLMSTLIALAGHRVTAVDIHEGYNKIAGHLANLHGTNIDVTCSDMLKFEPDEPVDAVVFCESFHHCDNPILLVEKMSKYVKPNGKLFFFGEPVTIFPVPWGVRLDGQSIWAAREHGWLELGFNTAFFYDLFRRNNWELKSFKSNVLYSARAIVASRI